MPEQPGTRPDRTVVSPKRTNALDLLGKRFGRLKVVAETDERGGNGVIIWLCDCSCGSRRIPVMTHNLTSGNSLSCGCWQVQRTRECHPRRVSDGQEGA